MAVHGGIEAVASAQQHALEADSADQALDRMMGFLHGPFVLWYAAIAAFTNPAEAVIIASWTPVGSPLEPGVRVNTLATPHLDEVTRRLRNGHVVAVDPAQADLGLLGELLTAGARTTVIGIPLEDDTGVVGVMGFVSSGPEGLDDEDVRLLQALVAGSSSALVAACRRAIATEP